MGRYSSWGESNVPLCTSFFSELRALRKIERWAKVEGFLNLLQQNGFLAVLIARIIPVLPSAAINMFGGIAGISFSSFFVATVLGKFPTMLAYTLAGHNIANDRWLTVIWVSLFSGVLFLIGVQLKKKWS